MKKTFSLLLFLFPILSVAQNVGSLTVFAEQGDKFYLYLDGKQQNDVATSHIRVQDLPDLYYSAKIVFENSALTPISRNNLYVSDGDDILQDASYRIRKDKAGKARLNFYSMSAPQKNFMPQPGMHVYYFGQLAQPDSTAAVAPPAVILADSANLGSLQVFSQNGDKFFLYLDGNQQNEIAQSNVRINAVPGLYYNARIIFQDKKLAPIVKNNLYVSDGEDNLMDASYRIRKDKQGKPRLNFYSMKAPQRVVPSIPGMHVYQFGNNTSSILSAAAPVEKPKPPVTGKITNLKITEKEGLNKTVPKTGISKTAVKPDSATITAKPRMESAKSPTAIPPKPAGAKPELKKCSGWPMGKGDLKAAKKAIEEAGKEESKLLAAQELISANCLSASQVTEFCGLFKSEKVKLAFAKYAYQYTLDRKNYSEVARIFTTEASKKELNKFISNGG